MRIWRIGLGLGVICPLAIDHKAIFVAARRQRDFLGPSAAANTSEWGGAWFPIVERARHRDTRGFRGFNFKTHRRQGRSGLRFGFGFGLGLGFHFGFRFFWLGFGWLSGLRLWSWFG